jgi:hypothetical protein
MDFTQKINFSGLVNNELTQIKISQFIVHFLFLEGSEIAVESGFEHVGCQGETLSKFEVYGSVREITVHNLLGKKIKSACVESRDSLRLIFDNEESIRIIRDDNRIESCSLSFDGKTYIVS